MPTREVQNMIPTIQGFLKNQPVERAYLFGSCSRGEETKDSDVDLMVDLDKSSNLGLLKFIGIKLALEDLLHRSVDLVERQCLLPFAQESANRDKILIYERTYSR